MRKKTQSTVIVAIVAGLLLLAFRDPHYGEWGVPYDAEQAVTRIGGNIGAAAKYMTDLAYRKNREMQDVHDNRMDRNDRRIERSGGEGR
jgi:hypothetical protein